MKYKMPWAVTILNAKFNLDKFPAINNIPYNLKTVLGFSKFCMGNPDYFSMAKQWHQKRYTMHSYNCKLFRISENTYSNSITCTRIFRVIGSQIPIEQRDSGPLLHSRLHP